MARMDFELEKTTEELVAKKQSAKMRLEFVVPAELCEYATHAIEKMNAEATIYEAKGCGCDHKFKIDINKGTGTAEIRNSERRTIVSIVDANKAEDLISAVEEAAGNGSSLVVVSPVYGVRQL